MLKLRNPVRIWRRRQASLAAALLIAVLGAAMPAAAFDLFGGRSVDVQFATPDGKPMADAEVRVYSPGNPGRVALTGRTDKEGKFSFETDRDGLWTAEARDGTEIARATVRVGSAETHGDSDGRNHPISCWACSWCC